MYHILYPKNDEHKIEGTNKNWDFLRLYFILPKMMKGKSKKNIKLGISYYILYPQYDGKKSKYNVLNIVKMIKQIVNINISLLSIHYLKIIRYERYVHLYMIFLDGEFFPSNFCINITIYTNNCI